MTRLAWTVAAGLVACTWGSAAYAQNEKGLALNQYQHNVAGDLGFSSLSPWVGGHLVPRGMVTFDYAKDPLVIVDANGNEIATVVSAQAYVHFGASLALWDRLMITADFPLAVLQSGEDSALIGLTAPDSAAPGDLRLGLRGRIFGEWDDAFQLGVGGFVYVPTGPSDGFTGEGKVYGEPHLLLGGRVPYFVWSAAAGSMLKGSDNPHTFTYKAGVGVSVIDDRLVFGPELFGSVDLQDKNLVDGPVVVERKGNVNAEWLFGAKFRIVGGLRIGAAGGSGITNGVGTPQFRVLGRLEWTPDPEKEAVPPPKPGDRDGDGVLDPDDACPEVPGVRSDDPKKNGCPSDRDGDGILDDVDACPDIKGVPNDDPKKHGCPPPGDRDSDGILDDVDACPDTPGIASDDPEKNGCPDTDGDGIIDAKDACPKTKGVPSEDPMRNGCPPDRDGDGIFDPVDACPDTPGIKQADPKKNGCPRVVVTEKEIKILEKIEFDFDKATIKPVSNELLDNIAQVLKDNPQITQVEVQGHTDSKGGAFYNKRLSDLRAKAVREALIQRGVEAERLTSKGYGLEKPIATNDTEEGRATNRRVQFQILKTDASKKKGNTDVKTTP